MSVEESELSAPVTEAPPVVEPAPAATEATPAPEATKPDPQNMRAVVEHALKNPTQRGKHATAQPRSPEGKFAGPPQFPAPQATPPAVAVPEIARPAMPKSLKKELEAHWNQAPAELAAAIAKREEDFEKGVVPLKEKARVADELLNEFRPYEQMMRAENATPALAIRSLLQTAAVLRSGNPALKAQHAAQMMRQFQISIEDVQQALSGNAPPQPALDPQTINQLIEQRLTQFQQQQEQAHVNALVEQFASNPEFEHFAVVRSTMGALMQDSQFLARTANLSEFDQLKAAYDSAVYANPEIRQQILAKQQAQGIAGQQAQQAQQVERVKKAAVQVTGAPTASPAPKSNPQDLHAVLKNAFARHR